MRRVQGDPSLRERWAGEARRAFREHWSEDAIIPRYLAVVARAARAKGRNEIAEALAPG
jgi:hypothetical protein